MPSNMYVPHPSIIQGGMGFGISNWRLARAVSSLGQLGVVSGTALDVVLARRLQDGDPGGHAQRALSHFPYPRMAQRVLDAFYIPGGKSPDVPYRYFPMYDLAGRREPQELHMLGNFVEVFLAREGHAHPIGINYLEKIQMQHLPCIYGAMLAGVAILVMGAGIPLAIPGVLDALAQHQPTSYPVNVIGANNKNEVFNQPFDPQLFIEEVDPPMLHRPSFLPIVSSETLASILLRKAGGRVEGFIVEGNVAGGHNAPPRGVAQFNADNEPIYGPRDIAQLAKFREFNRPFWLAGAFGSPEGLRQARDAGATGIQVGTPFALCTESGLLPAIRRALVRQALDGTARVRTDACASPTGFPFKVADLAGSLSDDAVFRARRRVCDVGFLRQPFRRPDGAIGYRCPAEPVTAYVAKGGREEDTRGRKCLCNALAANMGMAQRLPDGTREKPLVTMGDDLVRIGRFCRDGELDFSAEQVIRAILGPPGNSLADSGTG